MGVSTNSSSKNFVKIQSKHPCWSLFWVRLQPSVCNFTEQNSEVDFFFEILWKSSDVQQKNSSTCIHIVHTCRDTFKSVHHFFYFRKIWCVFYVTESSPLPRYFMHPEIQHYTKYEEILIGKLHFLCSANNSLVSNLSVKISIIGIYGSLLFSGPSTLPNKLRDMRELPAGKILETLLIFCCGPGKQIYSKSALIETAFQKYS